jgi:hypothetical protein
MGRGRKKLLAGGRVCVPDGDLAVLAARDDPPAVGAEHGALHRGRMA